VSRLQQLNVGEKKEREKAEERYSEADKVSALPQ
jgi:hypothetical protein